jgi:hypothetical protein
LFVLLLFAFSCDADPNKEASTTTPTEAVTPPPPVLFVGPPAGWRLPEKPRANGLTGLAGAVKKLAKKWGKGKKEGGVIFSSSFLFVLLLFVYATHLPRTG